MLTGGNKELTIDKEITQAVTDLNLPNSMSIDEFLNNPIIYEVPADDNTFIEELVDMYKTFILMIVELMTALSHQQSMPMML